jgi:hypothetical protein
MCPAQVIVAEETSNVSLQAALVENNQVIQALAANRANHPFDIRTLPRRARGRKHLLDAHCFHLIDEFFAEDAIAIPQ